MSGIPVTARPFFQEYKFDELDPQKHSELVIERFLAYGNRQELKWLFYNYSLDQVRAWVDSNGAGRLPLLRYRLWCLLLDLSEDSSVLNRRKWPH